MTASLWFEHEPRQDHLIYAAELLNRQNQAMPTTAVFLKQTYGNGAFCCFLDEQKKPFGFGRVQANLPFLGPDSKQLRILVDTASEHLFTTELFLRLLETFQLCAHKNLIVEVQTKVLATKIEVAGFRVGIQKHTMQSRLQKNKVETNVTSNFKIKCIKRPDEMMLRMLYECELAFIFDVPFALPVTHTPPFADYKKMFDNDRNVFFVAYDAQNHLAGYSCLVTDYVSQKANFSSTGVARAYREQGVATNIKKAALQWCVKEGLINVTSQNHATNERIIALNHKLGFEVVQTRFEMIPQ